MDKGDIHDLIRAAQQLIRRKHPSRQGTGIGDGHFIIPAAAGGQRGKIHRCKALDRIGLAIITQAVFIGLFRQVHPFLSRVYRRGGPPQVDSAVILAFHFQYHIFPEGTGPGAGQTDADLVATGQRRAQAAENSFIRQTAACCLQLCPHALGPLGALVLLAGQQCGHQS